MSSATTLHEVSGHGLLASGRSERARMFRRAIRHSRFVRVLRVAVPTFTVLLIGGLAISAWLDPLRALTKLPLSTDHVMVSGTRITMAAPKLRGFTSDARKYDLSARAATQDVTNPDIMEFQDIIAKFETPDKIQLDLTAARGVFNRKTALLTLSDNVLLVASSGYRVRLDEVKADTKTGTMISDKPVRVEMLQGTLEAKRLEVQESGEVLNFDGGVQMTILPNESSAPPEPPAQP